MNGSDEFYIGYARTAPPRTARWIRRAIIAAVCSATGISALLVWQQRPFAAAIFDHGQPRTFSGVVRERPFPHAELDGGQRALLVAPGKHGAAELMRGFDGRRLDFSATRIQRDGELMLEALPGSLRAMVSEPDREPKWTDAGRVELHGEIVDTKCYLGVMNPGEGKVHRDSPPGALAGASLRR